MKSRSNVADKAVSTDKPSETVCINAIMAILMENKLAAIRAESKRKRRWGFPFGFRKSSPSPSPPPSPDYCCHHRHHTIPHYHFDGCHHREVHREHHHEHEHEHDHKHDREHDRERHNEKHKHKKDYKHHKSRKKHFDSTPPEQFIADRYSRTHYDDFKGRRRIFEEEEENPRRKRRESKISSVSSDDTFRGLDSPLELMSLDKIPGLQPMNKFDHEHEHFDTTEDYPGLHRSAYPTLSDPFLNIDYNEDYMALDLAEELAELEKLDDSLHYSDIVVRDSPQEQDYPPRRKRKRKQHELTTDVSEVPEVTLVNRDELPPRAKWTIVATACILLAMSLILVGVTLRMAPIIDDMGDGRRASVSKKLQNRRLSTVGTQRKNSVRQTKLDDSKKNGQIAVKSPMELEQARKHRRTIFIVLGIFVFLIAASILIIVVTLTNNSFHIPPIRNQELTKQQTFDLYNKTFRKENEELMNTLNQDTTVPQNSTVPP